MAKFVIECSKCGNYVEGSNFIFAKKMIECSCGNMIDVKAEKLASKVCPHCSNLVVYDQSKGEKAKCPVCHNHINPREGMANLAQFTCPSCACKLTADINAETYTCPLCETVINVPERVKKEEIKKRGVASVIKYEGGNDVFVWKHPIEDFNLGSQLIVHESQEALFFKDGKALDLFGAGRFTLATQNLPVLENLYKLPLDPNEVFHSEVYFVNLTTQMGIKWGTDSKVRFFDPASGLHVEIGACGNFNLRVCDSRRLVLKLVGTTGNLSQSDIAGPDGFGTTAAVGKFKALIMNTVKSNLARTIKENNINVLEIDEHIDLLSSSLCAIINETLEDYGLTMPEFYITSVMLPDDDPDFVRLKRQFAEKTLRVRQENIDAEVARAAREKELTIAQTEAEKIKIQAMAEAEAYKAQAYAEAEEMRAKGYTYAQETARNVGMEAMKNGIVSENGGGAGGLGDVAGLGIALGTMGGVINMTKDAMNPMIDNASTMGATVSGAVAGAVAATDKPVADTWTCACGASGISSNFCPECGAKKPAPPEKWVCPACGKADIISNFCPDCGAKKPTPPEKWTCPECGKTDIESKFCPDCGTKKGE